MTDPITQHKQLKREQQRIQAQLEKLEKDDAYQKAVAFKKDIQEVLEMHSKSEEDLLQMLTSSTSTEPQKRSSRKPRKELPEKCFINPHTGESVYAKTLKDPNLKPWIEQYGPDMVKSWMKKVDDKDKPPQQSR